MGEKVVVNINGIDYYGAIAKTNSLFNKDYIKGLGVLIGTVAGDIVTMKIPVSRRSAVENYEGIEFIQYDTPIPLPGLQSPVGATPQPSSTTTLIEGGSSYKTALLIGAGILIAVVLIKRKKGK